MSSMSKVKTIFLFFVLGSVMLFSAGTGEKKFEIETGQVLYIIFGSGKLTADVNLTIKGKGKLRFKDWGIVTLIEEDLEEITSGAINNINKVQRCTKLEDKQRLDVDFENKKILERKMPKGNLQSYITKDLVKKGQEEIAGYTCDIWEGDGVRKCIYKGIPLLVENYLLGVYYQKKASKVTFNIDTMASACSVPSYPIEKFSLFKTSIKTKSKKPPKELSKIIESVYEDMNKKLTNNKIAEENLTLQQKKIYLDKIGQNIFEKQKEFLPKFLLVMQKSRVCLQQAENQKEANSCLKDVIRMKLELTKDKQNNITQWKGEEKEQILNQFDENIFLLESKMQCVRASKNITDLSNCMK